MPGKGSSAAMRTAQVVRVHGMKGVESVSGENPVVNYVRMGSFQEGVVEGKYGIPWHVYLCMPKHLASYVVYHVHVVLAIWSKREESRAH